MSSGLEAFLNQSQESPRVQAANAQQTPSERTAGGSTQINSQSKDARHDIHGFYKFLFENDLKSTKERTLQQLESVKELNDYNLKESEVLKLENQQLKKFIGRYQKMIDELNDKEGAGENGDHPSTAKSASLL